MKLELNYEQAVVLFTAMMRIGGDSDGPRGRSDEILGKIEDAFGFQNLMETRRLTVRCKGSLWMTEQNDPPEPDVFLATSGTSDET